MLERIVIGIATRIIEYLLGRAEAEVRVRLAQLELDRQRRQVNEENAKRYEEAKDRAERRKAAIDLINGTAP